MLSKQYYSQIAKIPSEKRRLAQQQNMAKARALRWEKKPIEQVEQFAFYAEADKLQTFKTKQEALSFLGEYVLCVPKGINRLTITNGNILDIQYVRRVDNKFQLQSTVKKLNAYLEIAQVVGGTHISVKNFAEKYKITEGTIYAWHKERKLIDARKINGKLCFNEHSTIELLPLF